MTGIFPSDWKQAKIIPVPKGRNTNEYRPISILPFLSKVFEKIVQKQLNIHIRSQNLLSSKQFGFREKHSCTTAIINVVDEIRLALDDDLVTFLVLLDFSKAFDTVDHQVLCQKLSSQFGLSPLAVNLMKTYLQDRVQSVSVNNKMSTFLPTVRGVPQGSVLGPLLFSLYINELPTQISKCAIQMFADDVQLIHSCPLGLIENGAYTINHDLEQISNWSQSNGLFLNPSKTKCIVISKTALNLDYFPSISLNGIPIEFTSNARNLGMLFNRRLTWDSHIIATVGKVYGILRMLWSTQHFTPLNIRMMIAKTVVIPILTYGCEVFCNCDANSRRKINVAFNNIARYIFGLRRFDHISDFSRQIYNISIDHLVRYKTLLLLYNIINTQQPPSLFNKIRFSSSHRSLMLIHPRFTCRISEQQFFIIAIRLWNMLPRNLRMISGEARFRVELRSHFQSA